MEMLNDNLSRLFSPPLNDTIYRHCRSLTSQRASPYVAEPLSNGGILYLPSNMREALVCGCLIRIITAARLLVQQSISSLA